MPKRLLALNLLLAVTAVFFSIQLARVLSAPRPVPPPSAVSVAVPAVVSAEAESPPPPPSLAAYGVVATRNLFNPNRSETIATAAPLALAAKPILYGVVINGSTRLAYIEDPATRRIFGYTIGDAVAGGQLEEIEADRVVIKRPEGPLEVKLKDPNKPKPVVRAPTAPPGIAAQPGMTPAPLITPSAPAVLPPGRPVGPRPPGVLPGPQGAAAAPGAPAPNP